MRKLKWLKWALVILTIYAEKGICQQWQSVNAANGAYSFMLPENYFAYDTLNTFFYRSVTDNVVEFESHYTDVAPIDYSQGDPYQMFAQTLLLHTQGTLESANWIQQSNITGREIGVRFINVEDSQPYFLFVRVFFNDDKLYSFSASSREETLPALLSMKTIFFNSIDLNTQD